MELQDAPGIQKLRELSGELLAERRLILASNRGLIEYRQAPDGTLRWHRGSGGVVTALTAVSQYAELTLIACAMDEGDRQAAAKAHGEPIRSPFSGQKLSLRFLTIPQDTYDKHYNVFCNPLLWFLQHYMWNSPYTPNIDISTYDAWENGYVPVNQIFAAAVVAEAKKERVPPLIMLHDYHLYLAAGFIRESMPTAIIQHFTHIPWPSPSYWQLLPAHMRQSICDNMCANNIVGFQTVRDVRNFLHTCEAFLEDAEVDHGNRTVWLDNHLTMARHYPISVDVADLRRMSRSALVREHQARLRRLCGEKTIVRVDRAEPSKNIVRGFRAFEMLLDRYPEWLGEIRFLAFIVPSRGHLRQYRRYQKQIERQVAAINDRFGTEAWQPIQVFFENNYAQAVAAMRLYDVLLVNAVIDGMNLVAKEGPTVNMRDGVLILSETVGAFEQLGPYALAVCPADIEGTVQALQRALTMPSDERRQRADALRQIIRQEDIIMWIHRQLADLRSLV